MRILHVAESAKGGVGTYISELARLQQESLGDDAVRVVAPADHAFQIGGLSADAILPYPRLGRSIASLRMLARAVSAAVGAMRPDIIHAHSTFAGLVVRLLYGWRRHRPVIIYCPHGWAFDVEAAMWKRLAAAAMESVLALLCDRIIAISNYEGRLARKIGIPASKLEVVRNGLSDVACAAPQEWDDTRLKVLFVGRLDRQKGFDTLADALLPLATRISVRVAGDAVAGSAPPPDEGSSEMLGWLSGAAIQSQLAAADLLVVPSRWEGFGLVAIEAMRAGRMVIASDVGGLREIIDNGVTGFLVPPDIPVALARRLATVTKEMAREMGEAGRSQFLTFFLSDRMHRQLQTVYRRCLPPERVRYQLA